MFCKIGTVAKKFSYFSLFFYDASFTIWLNVYLSSTHRYESISASIVAALRALYKRANSPNKSPEEYFFNNSFFPKLIFEHDSSPFSTI